MPAFESKDLKSEDIEEEDEVPGMAFLNISFFLLNYIKRRYDWMC